MSNLKETRLSTKRIYKGSLLEVYRDVVSLPDGNTSTREWINHPGAACVIPVLRDGKIALIKQYRYAVKAEMIECPAGKLDQGETPEHCAHRELREEIGYTASKMTFACNIHPAVGFASEKMWIYLAEDLQKTTENKDHDEFIQLFPTALSTAINMVWHGVITDVKTIIGLLWAKRLLS